MKPKIVTVGLCFLIYQVMLTALPRTSCSENFAKIVTLEEKTPLEVKLIESCSSQNATVGQTLKLETTTDVIVDKEIVIKKGSEGTARVLKVKSASFFGQAGELAFVIEYVMSVDGQRIPLTLNWSHQGEDYVTATTMFGYCCCPLIWLYKGKEAVCLEGTKYTVFVAADRKIKVTTSSQQ